MLEVTTSLNVQCQPLKMKEISITSWHIVAVDIQEPYPGSKYILLLIDYRSRYPVAAVMKSVTANNVRRSLLKTFAIFGYPKKITADNGPQFIANEFTEYLRKHNIEHRRVTPYWPAANGEVERMNRTIKRSIQCAVVEGKKWDEALHHFFLGYTALHLIPQQEKFQQN